MSKTITTLVIAFLFTITTTGQSTPEPPTPPQKSTGTSYSISIDNDYELTKIMAEEVVMKYANTDMSCSILNISRVYGPGMKTYSNGVNKIIKKIMKDRRTFADRSSKGPDQEILRTHVWPWAKSVAVQHDAYYCAMFSGSIPWPTKRLVEPNNYIAAPCYTNTRKKLVI